MRLLNSSEGTPDATCSYRNNKQLNDRYVKENHFLTRYSTNLALLLVNIFLIYISRHSEVGNLAYFLLPNQNIASGKISMNYLEQTINHIYLITAANILNIF